MAEEIEALFESEIENSAIRIGLPPKRAIPFKTDTPFKKMATAIHRAERPSFIKLKSSAMVSSASPMAFIPTRTSPTAGTVANLGPSSGARICRSITAETAAAFLAAQLRS